MKILNLCADEKLPLSIMPKLNGIELVSLSPTERMSFENVLSFLGNNEMIPEEFSKMAIRYTKKYGCEACLLDRGLPGIGLIEKYLQDDGVIPCFMITVTEVVRVWGKGKLETKETVHCRGFELRYPDGKTGFSASQNFSKNRGFGQYVIEVNENG